MDKHKIYLSILDSVVFLGIFGLLWFINWIFGFEIVVIFGLAYLIKEIKR